MSFPSVHSIKTTPHLPTEHSEDQVQHELRTDDVHRVIVDPNVAFTPVKYIERLKTHNQTHLPSENAQSKASKSSPTISTRPKSLKAAKREYYTSNTYYKEEKIREQYLSVTTNCALCHLSVVSSKSEVIFRCHFPWFSLTSMVVTYKIHGFRPSFTRNTSKYC